MLFITKKVSTMKLNNDINLNQTNTEEKVKFSIEAHDFDTEISKVNLEDIDNKTIKFIERQVRNSYEYRSYTKYLKEELDLTKCALIPSLDTKTLAVTLEFHHFPFTLYDISEIVVRKMIDESAEGSVSTFDVSNRIVEEHYKNNIGLVPLTSTLHEMAHNGAVFIPMDKVNGNYKQFMINYDKFIGKELREKIQMAEMFNGTDNAKNHNTEKLRKRIAEYEVRYNDRDPEDLDI
jgi:hypothetical protein